MFHSTYIASTALGGVVEAVHTRLERGRSPTHFHDELAVGIVVAGTKTFRYRHGVHRADTGCVTIICASEPHAAISDSGVAFSTLYIPLRVLAELQVGDAFDQATLDDPRIATALVRCLEAVASPGDPLMLDERLAMLMSLLATLQRAQSPRRAGSHPAAAFLRARRCMEEGWSAPLSLCDISSAVGATPQQLIALFHRHSGMTPYAFLTQLRIRNATALLKRGRPIVEVALLCGFGDQPHFTRRFKALMGTTPAAYVRAMTTSGECAPLDAMSHP